MIDPRPYFDALTAAYAIWAGGKPDPATVVLDVITGADSDGVQPYAAVVRNPNGQRVIAFRGTEDRAEWMEDFDVTQVQTDLGAMAAGNAVTWSSLKSVSCAPLTDYSDAIPVGHSRGGPLALCWAAKFTPALYHVFACPRLVSSDVLGKVGPLQGMAWQIGYEAIFGDVVPLADPFYPSLPNVTHLSAPQRKPLNISYHHAWTTYQAAIDALLAVKAA